MQTLNSHKRWTVGNVYTVNEQQSENFARLINVQPWLNRERDYANFSDRLSCTE